MLRALDLDNPPLAVQSTLTASKLHSDVPGQSLTEFIPATTLTCASLVVLTAGEGTWHKFVEEGTKTYMMRK